MSYSVDIGPIQSILVPFCTLCPVWPYSILSVRFGSVWSIRSYSGPLQCYKLHFSPFVIIWFYSVYFGPIWSFLSALVLFGLIQEFRSILVHFSSIQYYSVYLVLLVLIWSYLIYFGPIRFIQFYSVLWN